MNMPCCGEPPTVQLSLRPTSTIRHRMYGRLIQVGIAALISAVPVAGCVDSPATQTARTTSPQTATVPPSVQWTSDPEAISSDVGSLSVSLSGDGVFRVPADLPPGNYHSDGARSGAECSWERLSAIAKDGSTVIDSGSGTGPQQVTIEPSDTAFLSRGCQLWRTAD